MNNIRPPRVAAWLVQCVLTPSHAGRVLGDLDEEYVEKQRSARGSFRARLWYWRQALLSIGALRNKPFPVLPRDHSPMQNSLLDVRFALRQLAARPTYTLATILTFALGIGATTAIFAMVHGVLLRPLPYDGAENIVRYWAHSDDGDTRDFSFRVNEYRELRDHDDIFEYVGAEFPATFTLLPDEGEPRQLQARRVSSDFFRVFGVEPALGRMFTAEETDAGDAVVAVVSHSLWRRELGGDANSIGRTIDLGGTPFEVIGVLPADYQHVSGADAEVFFPYSLGTSRWTAHWLDIYGRLQPNVATAVAEERVNTVIDAVAEADARTGGWYATGESLHEMTVGDVRPALWATFATAVLVMLIGCVNVAMLTLARMRARVPELALRSALGAGRGRIMRQLLVESVLLSVLGGAVGLAVAFVTLQLLLRLAPAAIPRLDAVALDPVVLGSAAGATFLIGLVLGLAAGYRAVTGDPQSGLAGSGHGSTRRHSTLGSLVSLEVAMAITLLVAAGLMVRTLDRLQREDLGFRRNGVLSFRVAVPSTRYPEPADTVAFYTELRDRLLRLPDVTHVGAGTDLPVSGEGAVSTLRSEDRLRAGNTEGVTSLQRRATVGFLETLGVPLLAGRTFDSTDTRDGTTVLVISGSLARALFGEDDPIGRRVTFRREPDDDDWKTVIGVVGDVRYQSVDQIEEPQLYQFHPQSAAREMAVVVRTRGNPRALIDATHAVVTELDPQVPVYDTRTLQAITYDAMADRRFVTVLISLFASVALILAMAGIYGVLATVVGRQRQEIGVRMALGASPSAVTGQVVRRGMRWVTAGVFLGLLGAAGVTRLLSALLYGVAPTDPVTFAAGAGILAAVGLAASYLPARRAARVDPVAALRQE